MAKKTNKNKPKAEPQKVIDPKQSGGIPVDVLLKFYAEAELKVKIYEQTIVTLQEQVRALKEELSGKKK